VGSVGSVARSIQRSEEHEAWIQETDPRDTGTSIEKPIAFAIHSNIDPQTVPAVIPSFPNAYKPSSWRDTIVPVRTVAAGVADGVNEGIGLIKREIHKARTPSTTRKMSHEQQHREAPSLVFEEDDEAIFAQDHESEETSHHNNDKDGGMLGAAQVSSSGASGSTPSTTTTIDNDDKEHDSEDTWEEKEDEIAKVLAEEACFDDIGVAGFLLEEEEERQKVMQQLAGKTEGTVGKKIKKRK